MVPKIEEVQEFLNRNQISIPFVTETWLRPTITDSVVNIVGYSLMRRDRLSNSHGGISIYIKNDRFKYRKLESLSCCEDHEILWLHLRPKRLPRGFSSLIVAVIGHPHWTTGGNDNMREHLFQSLVRAESTSPNCAIIHSKKKRAVLAPWGRFGFSKCEPFWPSMGPKQKTGAIVGLFWLLFKSCFSSVKSQILSVSFLCLNNVLL